jgi:hypothetical protein
MSSPETGATPHGAIGRFSRQFLAKLRFSPCRKIAVLRHDATSLLGGLRQAVGVFNSCLLHQIGSVTGSSSTPHPPRLAWVPLLADPRCGYTFSTKAGRISVQVPAPRSSVRGSKHPRQPCDDRRISRAMVTAPSSGLWLPARFDSPRRKTALPKEGREASPTVSGRRLRV